ncbi:MAG: hypothetical protein GXX99_01665 [Clostridiales bacterium]|nr:hypothetical protein [Clostridiales bacterium]
MRKNVKRALSLLMAVCLMAGLWVPTLGANIKFSDIKGHWAESYVYAGAEVGYINGHPDGTFRPDDTVTRGQFSKMINHALGITNSAPITFVDCNSNAWYYPEVQKAIAAGYIAGYSSDNTFRADQPISRQEAAVIVARVISPPETEYALSALADSGTIADWAQPYVKTVYSKRYMVGDEQNRFLPEMALTRGAAVKIITLMLENETYIKNNPTISNSGASHRNTVFTNNVTVGSGVGDGTVTFGNCRVLGTLTVNGGGSNSGVVLRDSQVGTLAVSKDKGDANVVATGNTLVKEAVLSRGCHLEESSLTGEGFTKVSLSGGHLEEGTVRLSGLFTQVDVSSSALIRGGDSIIDQLNVNSRCDLVVQSGRIDELNVGKSAGNSTILMNSSVRCTLANIHSKDNFTGECKIGHAVEHVKDITYTTEPSKRTEYDDGSYKPKSGVESLMPSSSPSTGSTNVSLTQTIRLTFSDTLRRSNGNSVTAAYLEDRVIEVRQGSTSGSLVNFSAEINSSARIVTITPTADWKENTKYFVIVNADTLTNLNGDTNPKFSMSFTTKAVYSLIPTSVSPAAGSTKVTTDRSKLTITLKFSETLYQKNGKSLTASYVRDSVAYLAEGSPEGSYRINLTAVIENSAKTLKLTPVVDLDPDTTYYLVLVEDTLSSDNVSSNTRFTSNFSTGATIQERISISPDNKATNVATNISPVLTFDRALRRYGGNTLRESDLEGGYIELRRDKETGTAVDFYAYLSSDKKSITITPEDELLQNTTYYIVIPASRLEYSDGEIVPKTVFYFKTGNNAASFTSFVVPSDGKTPTTLTVDMICSLAGNVTVTAKPSSGQSFSQSVAVKAGTKKSVTFTDLNPKTTYTLTGSLVASSGATATKSINAATTTPALTLEVKNVEDTYADVHVNINAPGYLTLKYYAEGESASSAKLVVPEHNPGVTGDVGPYSLSGLEPGKKYTVTADLLVGTEKAPTKSVNFTTLKKSSKTSIGSLSVLPTPGSVSFPATLGTGNTYSASVSRLHEEDPDITGIAIRCTPEDGNAKVYVGQGSGELSLISGNVSKTYPAEAGNTYTFTIKIVAEDGKTEQQYTLDVAVLELDVE